MYGCGAVQELVMGSISLYQYQKQRRVVIAGIAGTTAVGRLKAEV